MKASRSKIRFIGLCTVVSLGFAMWAGTSAAASTSSPTASAATEYESYVQTLRTQLGLPANLATVRSEQNTDAIYEPLHIPLSPPEIADMQHRELLGQAAEKYDRIFAGDPTYAGSWLDQAAGGILHVAFTAPVSSKQQDIVSSMLPADGKVANSVVPNSLADLNALREKITTAQTDGGAKGDLSAGQGALVDVATNTVQISMPSDVPPLSADSIAILGGSKMVTIVREPQFHTQGTRDIRTGVLKGGEWIRNSSGSSICTMGYADIKNSLNQLYSITAGHCSASGPTWYQGYSSGGQTIGQVHGSSSTTSGARINCDCMAIGSITSLHSPIYLSNSNANVSITSTASTGSYVGQLMCQDGANSYEHLGSVPCGAYQGVGSYTISESGQAFTLTPALMVTLYSLGGDSGAPLVSTDSSNHPSTRFYGLLSGGSGSGAGSHEYFSESAFIASRFNATFQFN